MIKECKTFKEYCADLVYKKKYNKYMINIDMI